MSDLKGLKTMKNKAMLILITIFTLCFMIACTDKKSSTQVYSISGENDEIIISNGLIIITDKEEKFIGGDIRFKSGELDHVVYSNTKFYFYKDGSETEIQSNFMRIEGSDEGTNIQPDLGTTSSSELFYGNDLESIKESLNFSLTGNLISGDSFEYKMELEVKQVY